MGCFLYCVDKKIDGERSFTYTINMKNTDDAQNKIKSFWDRNKRMPSFSEIATALGYKSKNSVFKLIEKLEEIGFVSKDRSGKLVPGDGWSGIKILGLVEAGFPSPAEQQTADVISLDDFLISNRESSFILEVKGESMIDAGIHEGDLVVADRSKDPRLGDIVIADVDGGWTMKYLREKKGQKYLEPANDDYDDIHPEGQMQIGAVVVSVIRKY
jgi:SOS regulatory protein LexA